MCSCRIILKIARQNRCRYKRCGVMQKLVSNLDFNEYLQFRGVKCNLMAKPKMALVCKKTAAFLFIGMSFIILYKSGFVAKLAVITAFDLLLV